MPSRSKYIRLIVSRLGLPSEYDYWLAEYSPIIPQKSITTNNCSSNIQGQEPRGLMEKCVMPILLDLSFPFISDLFASLVFSPLKLFTLTQT